MHVLLLEPNQPLGQLYRVAFTKAGHTVTHVMGAQQAIGSLDTQTPDVIVLELQLAGHSGVEFLYELRSYPEWQHIPVVVQSMVNVAAVELQAAQLLELGVRAHLYKPLTSLRKLLQAVNEHALVT